MQIMVRIFFVCEVGGEAEEKRTEDWREKRRNSTCILCILL